MQNKYPIRDIEFNTGEEKVVKFDFGVGKSVGKKKQPKPTIPEPAPAKPKPNPKPLLKIWKIEL